MQKILLKLIENFFGEDYINTEVQGTFKELIAIYLKNELAKHTATMYNKFSGEVARIGEIAFKDSYYDIQDFRKAKIDPSIDYYVRYAQLYSAFSTNQIIFPETKIGYFNTGTMMNAKTGLYQKSRLLMKEYPMCEINILLLLTQYFVRTDRTFVRGNIDVILNGIIMKTETDNTIYLPFLYDLQAKICYQAGRFYFADAKNLWQDAFALKPFSIYYYNLAILKVFEYNLNYRDNSNYIHTQEGKKAMKEVLENYNKYIELLHREIPRDKMDAHALMMKFSAYRKMANLKLMEDFKFADIAYEVQCAKKIYESIDENPYFEWMCGENATNVREETKKRCNMKELSRMNDLHLRKRL